MPRLFIILTVIVVFALSSFAQDPGVPDSVIIGTVAIEPGVPSVMLPIYVVNDEPVEQFVLPFEWESSDGNIHPARAFYFNTLLQWDETFDTLNTNTNHIILTGTNDTGEDTNPTLNTGLERELVALIRIVIDEEAIEQVMEMRMTFDGDYGQPSFYYNGMDNLMPVVSSGAVIYQHVGIESQVELPNDYNLSQNYPNPFNMHTEIAFTVPQAGDISLEIYDILGRKIRTLVSANYAAGFYSATWDGCEDSGETVSSGMYFYKLKSADSEIVKKMTLVK